MTTWMPGCDCVQRRQTAVSPLFPRLSGRCWEPVWESAARSLRLSRPECGRPLGPFVPFEVRAGESTFIDPVLPPLTYLQALVVDQSGRPLPAKVSVVAQYDRALTNTQRRSGAVFDVQAGEDYRFSDMLSDSKEGQRAVIEAVAYTDADGHVTIPVRPGRYTVYFSRGFEYDLALGSGRSRVWECGLCFGAADEGGGHHRLDVDGRARSQ
jgi:hypothetical protein